MKTKRFEDSSKNKVKKKTKMKAKIKIIKLRNFKCIEYFQNQCLSNVVVFCV